jgi:hypothetical protein
MSSLQHPEQQNQEEELKIRLLTYLPFHDRDARIRCTEVNTDDITPRRLRAEGKLQSQATEEDTR